uniref:MULE transposase domain-containing protein n=1 Tax=Octopus bimaculoides TaxID=37653 RepID=A0A0L8HTQ2_OCTBM
MRGIKQASVPALIFLFYEKKKRKSQFLANSEARTGFEISEEYCKLDNGEQFLRYDSGIEDQQHMLVFASESALQDIASYCHLTYDGTFKIVPEEWFQLFSIHVQVKGSSFPRVFALLPNKTKQRYELVFEQL